MIIINAIEFNGIKVNTIRGVSINERNYVIVRKNQEFIKEQIINKLKDYHKAGLINSIKRPKNKRMQDHLNELIIAKRDITKSVNIIRKFYK